MPKKIDWNKAVDPLIKKYGDRKYPLEYKNLYQLWVMVVLVAQDSNRNINQLVPKLFEKYPDMPALAKASPDDLTIYISKARNFSNKAIWLVKTAQLIKEDSNIPLTMEELTQYPGIARKSANIIKEEFGATPEGVIVDLHVVRVANRLGITEEGENPHKIEKDIMKVVDQKKWGKVGKSMSLLGYEICKPTSPNHEECVMKNVCAYYAEVKRMKKSN